MGVKAALIVVTAGAGAYYVYTMMTSSEPASRTMDVPHLTASSASAAHPVAIEASVPEAPPPAPEPKPMPTAKLIPAGIAYPPTAADKRPVVYSSLAKLIKSAARSVSTADHHTGKLIQSWAKPATADHHTGKLIQSWAKPGSLAKAVTRAPAPRPMKPMQHWLEAHQLA